ncbi:glycosyltransferase family 4 protein [Desulforamulus aquiferis]|uniref:Glycosyltransferase family 4 protein n=2 Tax=Desulforamulus aquiferis TaxID=1397668 RepID=A0AAW7ZG36_9FIRM|nr:glycosyltransferase family 4 protein [Desulforamulus aquiferis]
MGGAERSVQYLAEALVKEGHKAVVISASEKNVCEAQDVNGVKVHYLSLKNIYWPFKKRSNPMFLKPLWHLIDIYNPWMVRYIKEIIKAEKPDIVHTNNLMCFSPLVWSEIKKLSIPIVHTIRDYYLLCPKCTMFDKYSNCEKQCLICKGYSFPKIYFTKFVDAVVGVSNYILEKHLSLGAFKGAKHSTIYNAYENKRYYKKSKSDQGLRLGFIGRITPNKGIEVILKAIDKLPLHKKNITLKIAGSGDKQYIKALSKKYSMNNISFLGFIPVEEFYPEIDVLIIPSLWNEPLGRITFEAYSYGVPVIASCRGGIPELVENESTGFLFDPEKPENLLKIINDIATRPELIEQMEDACLKKAMEFLPGKIAKSYLKIYLSLVKR